MTSSLSIFSCGQKYFEMILASQKCVFDKQGLGFKSSKNQKYFKNYFVKESSSASPSTTCNFCGRGGHSSSTCLFKKMVFKRIQMQNLKRFRLKNPRSLTLKDPKKYGYLNQLEFYVVGFKEG